MVARVLHNCSNGDITVVSCGCGMNSSHSNVGYADGLATDREYRVNGKSFMGVTGVVDTSVCLSGR